MSQAQISLVLHATNQTHVAIEQLQYYNIYCVSVHDCCVCSGHQFIAICFLLTQLAPGRLMQHCPASVTWTDTDWIGWLLADTLGWKHKQIWKWLRKGFIVHQYYLSSRTLPTQSTLWVVWDKRLSCHNSRLTQQPPSSEEPKQKKCFQQDSQEAVKLDNDSHSSVDMDSFVHLKLQFFNKCRDDALQKWSKILFIFK